MYLLLVRGAFFLEYADCAGSMERWLTRIGSGNSTISVASAPAVRTPPLGALMIDISRELLDSVHSAGACLVDIRDLAGKLVHLSAGQVEARLLRFVDDGEDQAVRRLLHACAFNGMKLDPEILCRCIGVCEDMLDSAPCFALQDESAVQPLLAATTRCGARSPSSDAMIPAIAAAARSTKNVVTSRIRSCYETPHSTPGPPGTS